MRVELICLAGLTLLICIWILLRRYTRRKANSFRKISLKEAAMYLFGSITLLAVMLLILKDVWEKFMTPI